MIDVIMVVVFVKTVDVAMVIVSVMCCHWLSLVVFVWSLCNYTCGGL